MTVIIHVSVNSETDDLFNNYLLGFSNVCIFVVRKPAFCAKVDTSSIVCEVLKKY